MPSGFRNVISVNAGPNSEFTMPTVMTNGADDRTTTVLDAHTADGQFSVCGTMDELLEFSGAIMRAVYSWAIVSGHSDWLGEEITLSGGKVSINVGQ